MAIASCGGVTYEEQHRHTPPVNTVSNSTDSVTAVKNTPPLPLDKRWVAGHEVSLTEVEATGIEKCFTAEEIPDAIFSKMQGKSWPTHCTLHRSDLRYLRILHNNADGNPQMGELMVNKKIADKVLKIFRKLYDNGYRIERMVLVDNYDGDDDASMRDNNTSSFNYRCVPGTKSISRHSYGLAIDLNPFYNPYIDSKSVVRPSNAEKYAFGRDTAEIPYKIDRNDLAYKLFRAEGFGWGGAWSRSKDYQHFEWRD